MIKAVIFDCFGVLVYGTFDEVYARAGGDAVKDADFIDELIGSANLGIITPNEMRLRAIKKSGVSENAWLEAIASTQYPSKELLAYAAGLKEQYKIAVLSNANIGTLERKFTPEQLAIFDAVIVSAEVHVMKPDPAIYFLIAEKLGVKPEECVFIDDSPVFCQAAEAVGMQAICYKNFDKFKLDLETILDNQ